MNTFDRELGNTTNKKKERDWAWAAAVGSLWVFGSGRDEGRIKHNYNKLTQTAIKIE